MKRLLFFISILSFTSGFAQLKVQRAGAANATTIVKTDTSARRDTLPNASGVFAFSVNGVRASTSGNITLPATTNVDSLAGHDVTYFATSSQQTVKADKTGNGDIEITDFTKGYILRSPNGTRWRLTMNDDGTITTTSL